MLIYFGMAWYSCFYLKFKRELRALEAVDGGPLGRISSGRRARRGKFKGKCDINPVVAVFCCFCYLCSLFLNNVKAVVNKTKIVQQAQSLEAWVRPAQF